MSHNLSTRYRPFPRYTPQDNARYAGNLGRAAAELEAARVCLEAGATAAQAADAATGNPVLVPLAEAMQQAGAQ